jgi:hypothetical protein
MYGILDRNKLSRDGYMKPETKRMLYYYMQTLGRRNAGGAPVEKYAAYCYEGIYRENLH